MLMKKDYVNLRKSKLLLLTLLAVLCGGVSPAWAEETISEGFEDWVNENVVTLPEGWLLINNATLGNTYSYDYVVGSSDFTASAGSNCLGNSSHSAAQGTTTSPMIVTPAMTGTFTFKFRKYNSSSSTKGYINIFEYDESTGAATGSSIWACRPNYTNEATSKYQVATITIGSSAKRYAIYLAKVSIDELSYTPAVVSPYKAPATLTYETVTTNSAVINWTAASTEASLTGWDLEYKKSADNTWTEVHGMSASTLTYSLTGLTDNTSYDVQLKAIYGENESDWKSTTFKTLRAPITAFPWSEDFTGLIAGIPDGWDNADGTTTTDSYKWTYNNSGHNAVPCLRFDSYNNYSGNTNFLKTPVMTFTQNAPMQLKFWYKNPAGGDFSLYISNDGGATYTTELVTGLTGASDWTEKVIDLPTDTYYENVVIVFKGTSNCGYEGAYIYLDDVLVKENANYAMSISGNDVTSNTIAFGEVKNTSTTKTFTITNDGAETLTGVSVISSDATVFTVSETGFDLAAGATKDIIVTFVKGVVGDYSETITVSQTNIATPLKLTVTGSYAIPSAAQMAVKIGEDAVGETVAFGSVGKAVTKTFTVENAGEADLTITSITSSNTTDFTVSPATLTVQGGQSGTFTVTFIWDGEAMNAEKTANITVTPSNDNLSPVTFAVTGTRIEQWSENFSGSTLPVGWEITNSTYWKLQDNMLKGSYSYGNYDLITPSLIVEEGQSLTFDYRMTSTYRSLDIQYSKDNGAWTNYGTISYSGLTQNEWYTYTIENLEAGKYKFRFSDSNYDLDNFEGFKRNMNDPKLGIYTDAACTVATTTSVTKDFEFVTTEQTTAYYIKNDGTGTMTLSMGDIPAGFNATLDKTSVAAGEHATLTITMPAENKGYHAGNLVITATDLGTFTVALSGVMVDDTKLNLDFATANIPSTWTANSWTKNASGYVEVGYTASTMQTSTLTATANESLVVVAKQSYTSSSYTFGVKYREVGTETWNDLIAAAYIGTSWVMLAATIETAGDYELQFTGNYAQIKHIYGLAEPNEPVMVVYDGETVAASAYDFGNVSDEADAIWTLTVKNEGKAALTGLAAALTGINAAHYSVEVSATELAANASTTITVKQLKDYIGSHEATLTITADGDFEKVIALSGTTRDHTKLFVDFDNPNAIPDGWKAGANWSVYTYGDDRYAQQTNYSTSSALVTTPLTVAEGETLHFQAGRYSAYSACELKVRYTADGGVTWSEYVDYSSQITSNNLVDFELTGVPAGTAVVEFYGRYVKLDNIQGFAPTTAPMFELTTGGNVVEFGTMKDFGNITANASITYTLANTGTADLVSTIQADYINAEITTTEEEGVTIDAANSQVTLAAGKTAMITLTIPYEEPYGETNAKVSIFSDGWVGQMQLYYTANALDPTTLYEEMASLPAGWYNDGWTISDGTAHVYAGVDKTLITEQYTAEENKNVLSFDAKLQSNSAEGELEVYTSVDRYNWTLANTFTLGSEVETLSLNPLADGNYYVKFVSLNASIDNVTGLKKIVPAPAHDLYISASTFPTNALIPETENGVTASATVYSLRAAETGVYAKLFFGETEIATAEAKDIALNGSATFSLTGNVPAEEGTYVAKIVVYAAGESFESQTAEVTVAHTRTLNIATFTRTDGEGDLEADDNNQISPTFSVTVENTGTTACTPTVKIYQGETVVATATAAEAVSAGATSAEIALTATNMSAGEGGELAFTAKAFWTAEDTEAKATSASNITISVTAAAPKFALYQNGTPVNDGDEVQFGVVKTGSIPTYTYSIKNEGNKGLQLKSIEVPDGFEVAFAGGASMTITVDGTFDFSVTMKPEQGKKSGDLVITYKVDESTNNTFTLDLSGRSIAADTWTEAFSDPDGSIPSDWTNNGWSVAGEFNDHPGAVYSNTASATLITPRLVASAGEELTFDVVTDYYGSATYAYSTDNVTWSEEVAIIGTGEKSFIAPEAGIYYIRFTGRGAYLQNFVGFKLGIQELEIVSIDMPEITTLNADANNEFVPNIKVKVKNTGRVALKANDYHVQLVKNGGNDGGLAYSTIWGTDEVAVGAETELTFNEPVCAGLGGELSYRVMVVVSDPWKAVTNGETYTFNVTASAVTFSDNKTFNASAKDGYPYPSVTIGTTVKQGWGMIVLPFDVDAATVQSTFGVGTKLYNLTSYYSWEGEITFERDQYGAIIAGKPYLIKAAQETINPTFTNVTIGGADASYEVDNVWFKGNYVAGMSMAGNYGITPEGKLAKGGASSTIRVFRAFLELPAGSAARINITDETTGIDYVLGSDELNADDDIYNLQGQRVEKAKKGFYIIRQGDGRLQGKSGKKVFKK